MNYLILLSLSLILFGSRFYYMKKRKLKFNIKETFILLFLLYLMFLFKMMLLEDQEFTLNLKSMIKQAQFIPSLMITYGNRQLTKTILITVPFGLFISIILSTNLKYITLFQYGFLVSLIIETLRLFKLNEVWSINHILLTTTGFLIGGLLYKITYKLLKLIKKEIWLDVLKDSHPQLIKKSYKLSCSLIIMYILGVYISLVYQTYPLSILNQSEVIHIDNFEISLDEKLSYLNINGYYKTNFNRLNHLFSTKVEINKNSVYSVYTLIEPYKPETDNKYRILVIGWISEPLSIQICYKNNIYTQQLRNGVFAVGYPFLLDNRPILDIYADSNPDHNLNINFYDEYGNVVDIPYYKETLDQ